MMNRNEIAKLLDHSVLQPFLKDDDIRRGCDIALKYNTATVCARPGDMKLVTACLLGSEVKPCTVIGFPHGAHRTDVKEYESLKALEDGCEELDMVIAIGKLLSGETDYVRDEIAKLAAAVHEGGAILKVILETCYLDAEGIRLACRLSEEGGADFVKTSTGYGSAGAKAENVALMRASVSDRVRVKASGGIRDLDTVLLMHQNGADRCGVSATEAIMQEAIRRGL